MCISNVQKNDIKLEHSSVSLQYSLRRLDRCILNCGVSNNNISKQYIP